MDVKLALMLLPVGVLLVGMTAIAELWHHSPQHWTRSLLRALTFAAGLSCLAVVLHSLL